MEPGLAEMDHWTYAVDSPFRPVAELLTLAETADPAEGEAWTGGPDQMRFRDTVLRAHLERRRRRGPPQRDLRPDELAPVAGTDVRMRRDAAAAAGRMLAAANAALATARTAGDPDALRTTSVDAASGYRAQARQERLWHKYFKRYYRDTAGARAGLPGGPHGPAAVRYMIEDFHLPARIAAPGYSNHQAGIAIDLQQRRAPGHEITNSTNRRAVAAWRASWLHKWLTSNAASCDFQPYDKEPWHWIFKPAVAADAPVPREEWMEAEEGDEGEELPAEVDEFAYLPAETEAGDSEAGDSEAGDSEAGEFNVDQFDVEQFDADEFETDEFETGEAEADEFEADEAGDSLVAELEEDGEAFTGEVPATLGETSALTFAEAALRGELLLEAPPPSTPPRPADEEAMASPTPTIVTVSIRTDFAVRDKNGTCLHAWQDTQRGGGAVPQVRAQVVGTGIQGISNARGDLSLNTTGLRDGLHTIRIEHAVADRNFAGPAGPTLVDPLPESAHTDPLYRPLNVWVRTERGQIVGAMVALFSPHGAIGNRLRATFDATHLPIDWKPVWIKSPARNAEVDRPTTSIDLIVVHTPDKDQIGMAINSFLDVREPGNAHYLIDHSGHIVKMSADRRRVNQTGVSRWRGVTALNPRSIGIEVMQTASGFRPEAIAALLDLIQRLRAAYPSIPAHRIVGHSDIATTPQLKDKIGNIIQKFDNTLLSDRRIEDPGKHFDWAVLERAGLGLRAGSAKAETAYAGIFAPTRPQVVLLRNDHDPATGGPARLGGMARTDVVGTPIADLQQNLERIGYSVRKPRAALGTFDARLELAVDRFQRHFFSGSRFAQRPHLGRVDARTAQWIFQVSQNVPA